MIFETLSPLHIGNGREITPIDFYPEEGIIHILDTDRLFHDLVKLGASIEELVEFFKTPREDLYVWKHYMKKFRLDPRAYSLYTLKVYGALGRQSSKIKEFIKENGKPYVPGSSIKGAIRTAMFYKALKECGDSSTAMRVVGRVNERTARQIGYSKDLVEYYISYLLNQIRHPKGKVDPKRADDILEAMVFGMVKSASFPGIMYEPKKDPLKALIIRDTSPIGRKHLSVYKVEVIGNPQLIPIWVEALHPGTELEMEIIIDEKTLKNNQHEFNGILWECLNELGDPSKVFEEFLWESIKEFYREVIKMEKARARGNSVKRFYDQIEGTNGYLIRLGWGSGWLSTTIGVLLKRERKWEELRRKLRLGRNPYSKTLSQDFPKTFRLATGIPMGWGVIK
ncbi:type III-A CRISPR-associated RAMP protein Csm5 [Thermococci archaeon]|nr:MAG: type III-A CRISPR-associated RAMP protein Csm5 [Thermococci archaeon]